ncbi:hypothetical protein Hdeb2414_s0001g00017831 [Helianthus debilis subsp. tardiflorus]
MYFGGINTGVSTSQQLKLQTTFVLNANPFLSHVQPSHSVGSSAQVYGQAIDPKAFLPQPRDVTSQVPQQAFYGNNFQPSNPNTARLDTSNLSKVSVEVAKEHMELLNTSVSSYCELVAGQIGNINITSEDYAQIDKEEMELIDIKWAFASVVRRAKDFMEKMGRTNLESIKDTYFNGRENGHFKRKYTKPPQ